MSSDDRASESLAEAITESNDGVKEMLPESNTEPSDATVDKICMETTPKYYYSHTQLNFILLSNLCKQFVVQ